MAGGRARDAGPGRELAALVFGAVPRVDYFQTLPSGIDVRLKCFRMLAERAKIIQPLEGHLKYPGNFLLTFQNLLQAQHRASLNVNNNVSRFHNGIYLCMASQMADTVNSFWNEKFGRASLSQDCHG